MRQKKEKRSGIVTLITDFGMEAEYAGAMKGAILSANPRCRIVDITHQIPACDILKASFVLKNAYPFFPGGTVHLVVVDPGVGTRRRPVLLRKGRHFFIGPDNGVFTGVLSEPGEMTGYEIAREEFLGRPMSATFHGRDLFGPVAGRLAAGLPPQRFGPPISDFVMAEGVRPKLEKRRLSGRVLWTDPFGNLITNVEQEKFGAILAERNWRISGKGWRLEALSKTYGEGKPGALLALFGSSGHLELAVNQGRAAERLGMKPGDPLVIRFKKNVINLAF